MSVLKDIIINSDAFKKVKRFWKKSILQRYFNDNDVPQIEIHSRNDRQNRSAPRIRIGNINQRSDTSVPTTRPRGEDIGNGITVIEVGKPKRCPICASPARDSSNNDIIVAVNGAGSKKWKCKNCDSIL